MRDAFISWSTPDASVVSEVVSRLQNATYTLHEYSQDSTAGPISNNVLRYVESSRLALIFLSAKSARAPWINTEVDWCYQQYYRTGEPTIIPILLGDVAHSDFPHLLQRDAMLRRVQVSAGPLTEDDLQKIERTVAETLAKPPPTVIPIALLAMTRTQAEELLNNDQKLENLLPLCSAVGMHAKSEHAEPKAEVAEEKTEDAEVKAKKVRDAIRKSLLLRYPTDHAEDFSPFPGTTMKKVVEDVVGLANQIRKANNLSVLWLYWCSDELFTNPKVRQRWSAGESILVLDSISSLHEEISPKLGRLPQPRRLANSAVLWVPPYTLHTASLTELTDRTLQQLVELQPMHDRFDAWGSENPDYYSQDGYQPYVAFDIGTAPTLRRWLFAAFGSLSPASRPIPGNAESMQQANQTKMQVGVFNMTLSSSQSPP